ncbi:MAG: hypothetical protein V3T86_12845 [Planctomycetota bacterium]
MTDKTLTREPQTRETRAGEMTFPDFDLARLMNTVFELSGEESFAVFADFANPRDVVDFAYLGRNGLEAQKHAYDTLYKGILANKQAFHAADVSFYGYEEVGGSNLDLPDVVVTPSGDELALRDVLARHSIVLYMGTYSATAPITALAKEIGFRGATMHGANDTIFATGLAVDYDEVSARAERMRRALTKADRMKIDWVLASGDEVSLDVHLDRQEAQKSHGIVHEVGEVANLPAGEVYYVPTGADGFLPQKFEDPQETICIFRVENRGITGVHKFVQGDEELVRKYLEVIEFDRNAGQLTELGLGTQTLPFAGSDIQDEKILGTAHLATGRSDHLGGDLSSASFKNKKNASHNDILWSPNKTPEVVLSRATMHRDGEATVIIENQAPTEFLRACM